MSSSGVLGARARGVGAIALVLALVAALVAVAVLAPAADAGPAPRPVKVMTRNLYLGADLAPVLAATDIPSLMAANAQIFTDVQATDFPARARALAAEIRDADPALIGLQEVALWRTGALDGPVTPAEDVAYDFLQLLRDALRARGLDYDVLRVQQELDIEAPNGLGFDSRLTLRDAILARGDLPRGELRVLGTSSGNFANNLMIPTFLGPITLPRGWTAADVVVNRRAFRFVNTHLEAIHPGIRALQAGELVAPGGPAAVLGPVVLAGDLNSDPAASFPESAAFATLAGAGFADTWAQAGRGAGATCCFSPLLDDDSAAVLSSRVDHVLTRGVSAPATRARLTGIDPDGRTRSGLWPSDHAGVVATLVP
jgi:endonuclease/exonuclease/phosphatase family metal-dependent hydrolase